MNFPDLITDAQASEERFLRQIFVRHQMAEWSKQPLLMARADGVFYWDVAGKRYLDALSGIYTVSVGHNNRRVIDAMREQLDALHFSPPMHGTNPVAVRLANALAEIAPGDLNTVMTFGHTIKGIIEGDSDPDVFLPELMEHWRAGRLPFDRMITTFPFSRINEAIAAQHHGDCVKVVLLMTP